jgi:hypothetical protein
VKVRVLAKVKYSYSLSNCFSRASKPPELVFNFFQKLICHLVGANRAYYCLLFDPHPSTPSSYSLLLLLSLFNPTPTRRAKEYGDERQRVEG